MKQSKSIEALQREISAKEKELGELHETPLPLHAKIHGDDSRSVKIGKLRTEIGALKEELKLLWCDIHNVSLSEKEKGICFDCQEEMKSKK